MVAPDINVVLALWVGGSLAIILGVVFVLVYLDKLTDWPERREDAKRKKQEERSRAEIKV